MKKITFIKAVNEAMQIAMQKDKKMLCYGLGATDPKAIFGTTKDLEKNFGKDRVFDTPTSENAMTGVAIGAALDGVRSITTHQRLDFFLLAMDQLVNNAAKAHYAKQGKSEGRSLNIFKPKIYLENHLDLQMEFGSDQKAATKHFIKYGY